MYRYQPQLPALIRIQFQARLATLLIPIDFNFLFMVEKLYQARYQSGSFSFKSKANHICVGHVVQCLYVYPL